MYNERFTSAVGIPKQDDTIFELRINLVGEAEGQFIKDNTIG